MMSSDRMRACTPGTALQCGGRCASGLSGDTFRKKHSRQPTCRPEAHFRGTSSPSQVQACFLKVEGWLLAPESETPALSRDLSKDHLGMTGHCQVAAQKS